MRRMLSRRPNVDRRSPVRHGGSGRLGPALTDGAAGAAGAAAAAGGRGAGAAGGGAGGGTGGASAMLVRRGGAEVVRMRSSTRNAGWESPLGRNG